MGSCNKLSGGGSCGSCHCKKGGENVVRSVLRGGKKTKSKRKTKGKKARKTRRKTAKKSFLARLFKL